MNKIKDMGMVVGVEITKSSVLKPVFMILKNVGPFFSSIPPLLNVVLAILGCSVRLKVSLHSEDGLEYASYYTTSQNKNLLSYWRLKKGTWFYSSESI